MPAEKKAAFKKAGQEYKPDEQKRIATTIANAMTDGELDDSEIEAITDATVADVEQGLGDLSGEDEEGDAGSALETVSNYLGWGAALSSLGGPTTMPLTTILSVGSDSTAVVNIYQLAATGRPEDLEKAFVQLTGLAAGKAIEAMIPAGAAAKKAAVEAEKTSGQRNN